jgi:DinB superfamily
MIRVMAAPQERGAPAWSVRLAADLDANDQAVTKLVAGLTEEQLNWQPTPGSWSAGQCLEHLCITNEAYLLPMSVAINGKPDSPVEQITPGWFGRWFIRSFIEPSPDSKRAPAPAKIRPTAHVRASVLERFHAGNQSCRELMVRAGAKNLNRIRFWNPFIPGIRFTVGTGLQIIVGHERRHLLQAERVLHSTGFPH